jgi:hypothetical protein
MYLAFYFKSYKQQRESVSSARKRFIISAKAFYQRESVSSARKRFISA